MPSLLFKPASSVFGSVSKKSFWALASSSLKPLIYAWVKAIIYAYSASDNEVTASTLDLIFALTNGNKGSLS